MTCLHVNQEVYCHNNVSTMKVTAVSRDGSTVESMDDNTLYAHHLF